MCAWIKVDMGAPVLSAMLSATSRNATLTGVVFMSTGPAPMSSSSMSLLPLLLLPLLLLLLLLLLLCTDCDCDSGWVNDAVDDDVSSRCEATKRSNKCPA